MVGKLTTATFCFLGLFVIAQALPSGPEDVSKYVKCATYADCNTGGIGTQKLQDCIDHLKPKESDKIYKALQDTYDWKGNNLYEAVPEYCDIDDAQKPDVYISSLTKVFDNMQKACADGSKEGECARYKKFLITHPSYIQHLPFHYRKMRSKK